MTLHVVLQNCTPDCITVGEQKVVLDSKVPPNQARGFDKNLYFQNLPVMTKMSWHYRVEEVFGNPNQK